jgi:hypothetical protein
MTTKEHDYTAASVDRIDSTRGYTRDNIQLVCKAINLGKKNFKDSRIAELIAGLHGTPIAAPLQYRTEKRYRRYQKSPKHFLQHKLNILRRNDKHKVTVSLTELEKKWVGVCYVTQLPIFPILHDPLSASLDRIDSNRPYDSSNTIITCQWANLARNHGDFDGFINFIRTIRANSQPNNNIS